MVNNIKDDIHLNLDVEVRNGRLELIMATYDHETRSYVNVIFLSPGEACPWPPLPCPAVPWSTRRPRPLTQLSFAFNGVK